ncbi:hypothetical protein GFS24_05125 [Chitinophaga sp. SYP-B3965]|uniref:hypothetical protein n=1 Tax=Chitinophaga sp. SYP-B3965 TaxID=2663120 RepID=UPI001299642D|nr:hypothetical protein [Chitinophaga sp. SYP-B3965]MRG44482.1 hypothetical protein [Chitinophaga sp. SYP-B3965]
MQYFTLNTIAEWISFLTSVVCLSKDRDPVWKRFSIYLLIVCLVETGGIYFRETLHQPNTPLYNGLLPIECFAVSSMFYHLLKPYGIRRDIFLAWITLFALCFLTELISSRFSHYAHQTLVLMAVVFILASLYYFYLVLKDDHYVSLGTYAPFWWVSGALIFYFGGTATNTFFQYLLNDPETRSIHYSLRYHIFKVLNVLQYGCWSYAFICRYRQMK